jgi:hypothetical protein
VSLAIQKTLSPPSAINPNTALSSLATDIKAALTSGALV